MKGERILLFLIALSMTCTALAGQSVASLNSSDLASDSGGIEDIERPAKIVTASTDRSVSSGSSPVTVEKVIKPRTTTETYLCLGVLAFGIFLVLFTGIVAYRKSAGWDSEATRIFAVSVIVTAGLFLMTAGYSDEQVAPMFGLLGTIVGYLLGKSPPGEQGTKPAP